jgi:outer membrane receptor protein involved in Fe transport
MGHTRKFHRNTIALAVAAAGMAATPAVLAQESQIEEVIVTATVREQSAHDIPFNISSMSGDDIVGQQITDQADLLRSISGVSLIDRGYRNSGTVNSIVIRGLNVDTGTVGDIPLNAHPTVSTYVDNTPLFANFVLKDLQRVEVLRGPQGTLYGSGALGGTVRYITNKPSTEGFEGEVSGEYSETEGSDGNNANFNLMINVPLTDRIAIRGHAGKIDNDGVIDYVNAYQLNSFGEPMVAVGDDCVSPREATDDQVLNNGACYRNAEDADDAELEYARLAVNFDVSDDLTILLAYQTQEDDVGARRSTTLGDNNQPVDSDLYYKYDDHESGQVLLEDSERDIDLYVLDVEWDLGFATLTSNSSYYEHEGKGNSDNGGLWVSGGEVDGTSRDWITNFGYAGWPRPAQRAERGYDDEAFIQELRLISPAGEGAGSFDWVLGAYYMDQDRNAWQSSWNPGMNEFNDSCRATGSPVCDNFWPRFYDGLTERDLEYVRDLDYEEYAVYGELTYHVTDSLHITGGARWYDYEENNNSIFGYPLVEGWESSVLPETVDEDDDVLLKGNIAYDINDNMMVYGTISEGFRRGGANTVPSLENGDPFGEPNADAIRTFGTDEVTNYEIGIKGRTENIRYTASAFYVDWDEPQLNTVTAWYSFYMAANGDSAVTQGIELELDGTIMDSVNYRVNYTWVDAELDEDFISPQTGSLIASDGASLPGTAEHVLSLSLDKLWAVGEMDLVTRVNAYYQDETENYIDQANVLNETFDSFWLLSASATLVMDDWQFVVFGKNLSDEEGVTGAFPVGHWSYDTGVFENWYGNGNRQMITQPRTIGASVSYRF